MQEENKDAMNTQEDVKHSNDNKIDQDFPGYPNSPAKENAINPETRNDKKDADLDEDHNDGGKTDDTYPETQNNEADKDSEQFSDGSGGAFSATEGV